MCEISRYGRTSEADSADTDPAQLEQLCNAEGIDLLIWAKNWPGEAPSGLAPAYENNSVAVYLVP